MRCVSFFFRPKIPRCRSPPPVRFAHKTNRMEENMKTINLRVLYPDAYKSDYYVEVPDEVAEVFETFERMEKAYMQRVYYHKAYYTLDCSDEIEHSVVFRVLSPEEIYERKLTREQLHAAIQCFRINRRSASMPAIFLA